MPIYVMLTKATDEGGKNVIEQLIKKPTEKETNKQLEKYAGVKVLSQYMLLGEYDFINIVEAPSDLEVLKGSVGVRQRGLSRTITMPAVSISDLKEILK